MYAACFQVSGWAGAQSFLFSGDTLKEVVDGLNGIQDLFFLGLMSRMDGEAAAGELTKLETFTERYQSDILTEEDVANFAVELSIGSIRCVELRSGEDALEKLAGKYPEARNMWEEPEEAAGGNGR